MTGNKNSYYPNAHIRRGTRRTAGYLNTTPPKLSLEESKEQVRWHVKYHIISVNTVYFLKVTTSAVTTRLVMQPLLNNLSHLFLLHEFS